MMFDFSWRRIESSTDESGNVERQRKYCRIKWGGEIVLWQFGPIERMDNNRIAKKVYVEESMVCRLVDWPWRKWSDSVNDCLEKKVWMLGKQWQWCMIRMNTKVYEGECLGLVPKDAPLTLIRSNRCWLSQQYKGSRFFSDDYNLWGTRENFVFAFLKNIFFLSFHGTDEN